MGSSRWLTWAAVAVVAGIFLARLPAIVEPMGPDQGVYATIGWAMQHGFRLYRDLFEIKPPGLYVTYWLGFALLGTNAHAIFWMDYAAAVLTLVALFDLCRRLVSARFGALAAAVFAIATWPAARHAYGGFLERTINETFISLFATASFWAAAIALARSRHRWAVVSGLVTGIAVVFKPMAAVYWPVSVVWVWLQADFATARRFALQSAAGALVVPIAALGWMWATGIMPDAWLALAVYNSAYLTLGDHSLFDILNQFAHETWRRVKTDEVWALGAAGAVVAVAAWKWRTAKSASAAMLGVLWLGAALAAVALNGPRMFQTYFMPALVPLSLLAAWLLAAAFAPQRRWRAGVAALVVGLIALMLFRSGSLIRAADVTRADTRQLLGATPRLDYLQRFQSRSSKAFSAADSERLADYLRSNTQPDERVFIFGMTASAYFLSHRLPASRFLFAYPAVSNMADRPEFRVETLAAELSRTAPRYIVLQRHNGDSFSGWRAETSFAAPPMAELLRSYHPDTEIGDYALYRRN